MQKKVIGDKNIISEKHVRWFSEIGKEDTGTVGGKGANLGEMFNSGFPVPPGFVIIADAYKLFLEETRLDKEIYSILNVLDVEKTQELEEAAKRVHDMIVNAKMPEEIEEEIIENYDSLNVDNSILDRAGSDALAILKRAQEPKFVAVRSSATSEDTSAASFAGQNETFLNMKGKLQVMEAVKKCWASLFTARSVYYRIKKGFKHEQVLIAVVVQEMVNSDKSGVIFSKDPVTQDENIIVESVFGLGEGIVSGQIQPDHYLVSRDLKILKKGIAPKKIAIIRTSSGHTETVRLTEERSKSQVLSEYEIKKLADYSIKLEKHYGKPQDTEFAVDSGNIYIVQTRPITTLEKKEQSLDRKDLGEEILEGIPASPGIGSGIVRIVHNLKDLEKVKQGDILVTEMTNPDMVVGMQKSAGIVTDEGGMTSHAAIVSREMGIPCVVGSDKATKVLKEGQEITVNGYDGKIYSGKSENKKVEIKKVNDTETSIKVIVDLPDFAARAAETGIKAVGLTRIEGIIAESGKHPFFFTKKVGDYQKVIFEGVNKIAEYFDELWIRTSDIRSDEYKNLEGAPKNIELNPMLGMHGIRFSLKYPELLKAELLALKQVSEKGKKIGIIVPQVISVEEIKKVKEMVHELEFHDVKVGVMVETPAAVQIIEELCEEGIDFISFGTNDLTQYTLAIDRGNEQLQEIYNELHPAMKKQLAHVIDVCRVHGVESSICGQAASNNDMAEFLVLQGIDSLSVNADKASEISELVHGLEEKGLRGSKSEYFHMAKTSKRKVSQENHGLSGVEEVNDLGHVKEESEKIMKDVKKKNEDDEKKLKEREAGIMVEEKIEKKGESKEEKGEEYPDVDIGFNIFEEQGKEDKKEEKKDNKKAKKEEDEVLLGIF
jgi:pyruvate, water dikinase